MPKTKRKSGNSSHDTWFASRITPALEIALYYGFNPINHVTVNREDREVAKHFIKEGSTPGGIRPEEEIALVRHYFSKGVPALPLMLFLEKSIEGKRGVRLHQLDIIGTGRSIADATIIKAAYEMARSEDFENLVVEINSVGDRDSLNRFTREFVSYFRKHLNDLEPECRQRLKKNPFSLLSECDHEKCKPIIEQAPRSIGFLSEPSRAHFMEVLELLEMIGTPYVINNDLIESPEFACHTIFRIVGTRDDKTEPEIVCGGNRWSGLAKKMGHKKDIPGISVTIITKAAKAGQKLKKIRKPQLYFIQMGQEAKLKSLILIETLRQARIPVYHSLTKDKLTAQLASAEHLQVPYILIMGQKESMENTVLVREMQNRSQDTVRIAEVAEYLRRLLK